MLYIGPIGAGAAGGAVTNLSKQGFKLWSGKQCEFDSVSLVADTALGAILGKLPKTWIPGRTTGNGSDLAKYREITTKFKRGMIKNVKPYVAFRMFRGRIWETSVPQGVYAASLISGSGSRAGYWPSPEMSTP